MSLCSFISGQPRLPIGDALVMWIPVLKDLCGVAQRYLPDRVGGLALIRLLVSGINIIDFEAGIAGGFGD
jgi:hypothetical protein